MTLTLDAWVIVIPDDHVLSGTVSIVRDRVIQDCAGVCVLNHLNPAQVRIAPVQIVVDLDRAVVFADDPAYAATRAAVEMAHRKHDPEASR